MALVFYVVATCLGVIPCTPPPDHGPYLSFYNCKIAAKVIQQQTYGPYQFACVRRPYVTDRSWRRI